MLRTLIFDYDGTVHNTKAIYGSAFRSAYKWLCDNGYAGMREYTDDDSAVYLGMTPPEMWKTFMPQLPESIRRKASAVLGESLAKEIEEGHAVLYPDAQRVLTQLKEADYNLLILSNCRQAYMNAHRKALGLDRFFSAYYCSESYGYAPKHEIIKSILAQWPGEYCVIGDRFADIEAGLKHGLHSIGCSYGFGTLNELKDAEYTVGNIGSLPQIISKIG